ncbi:molybdopterin-binding oxidoreductase [Novosphingobium marinum]|uniref:Anaerobic selenocysteine-containing dehydrogenase n=1 Tax=Novosphingobium marinum TaxID=1514948 RepID=A0A7Z0BU84_9SPHN|nr:molybdopterin-dependent oxidoreductase [Novosphingobium marinum]NYH94025.1 anaerobic selenocysteine-containing dehydrogenase [Novosphingobium marinum]GGC19030.1 molybdopterin-binding oxidoreductase [Novosphingobium marinum]
MTSGTQLHFRSCPFCEAACGTRVTANHVLRTIEDVRGDHEDPFSKGFVCPKAYALTQLHSDPDRLRKPLRRKGRDFEEISFEEAIAEAGDRLRAIQQKHGQHSVAYYFGNPTGHKPPLLLYGPVLMKALGSMQVYSPGTLDQIPKFYSAVYMFGGPLIQPLADLDRVRHLIVIGNNPVVSQGSMMVAPGIRRRLEAIRARGGKLVVIDPRRTETAAISDEYVAIRPGTDALLLLAMAHVIEREGLVDLGNVEGITRGLDDVLAIASRFPPERVAAATGIAANTIEHLALEFARADGAAIYGRTGTCTQAFGSVTSWLIDVLNTISGNLDKVGGNLFTGGGIPLGVLFEDNCVDGVFPSGRWHSRVDGLPETVSMLPTAGLANEMLVPGEGQVRGFVTQAGNVMLSNPNAAKLERAFESLEFMLSLDIYVNETTRHADIIIPGPSYAEHSDFAAVTPYETIRKFVKWAPPVFAPEPGMPHDFEIFNGIAARLKETTPEEIEEAYVRETIQVALDNGRPEAREVPYEQARAAVGDEPGPDRIFDILIRGGPMGDAFGAVPDGLTLEKVKQHPHGLDLGPLDEGMLPGILRTPDRKVDLAPGPLVEDVARLEASLASLENRDTMLMIGRRTMRSKNAWMHNIHLLVKGKDRCTLRVHPDDAERLGLATGGSARVATDIAEVVAPVEVDDEMMPGVVSLPHGWGHDMDGARQQVAREHPGVNANSLIDESMIDVPSASNILNGVPVRIEAA